MNLNNEKLSIIGISMLLIGIGLVGTVSQLNNSPLKADKTPTNLGWNGEVTATQYNADGEVIYEHQGENILTNEGANFIRSHLLAETNSKLDWVGLSNASSYSTDVQHGYLEGELTSTNLSRVQGTTTKTSTGTWEIQANWVANGSVDGVKATGLFPHDVQNNVTSDGNILVAEETMNSKAFRDGYEFELTWEISQSTG